LSRGVSLAAGRGPRRRQIVIAGDSAGGNLALATLHAIKAAGEPMPRAPCCCPPATDLTMSGASYVTHVRRDPMFSLEALLGLRSRYIQPEQMSTCGPRHFSAIFHGFPPLYFIVGDREGAARRLVRAAARAPRRRRERRSGSLAAHGARISRAAQAPPGGWAASERIVAFIARHANWPRIETCQSKGP
jgi:acetyl esterase/lipase